MPIYYGNFNWLEYASNETIIVIFPKQFALNDPVFAFWQWTKDALTQKSTCVVNSGVITSVTTAREEGDYYSRIDFSFGYFNFSATPTPDYKTLTVRMRNLLGDKSEFHLTAADTDLTSTLSTTVYTGTLEWYSNAKREMMTLVVPCGVTEGAFFGLYHQWTVDLDGVEKTNHPVNGVFQDVKHGGDGTTTASYKSPNYTYNFTFSGKERGWFVMSNAKGDKSPDNHFALTYSM